MVKKKCIPLSLQSSKLFRFQGDSFASEMDLDDLLSEPAVVNSRARVKFQPKASRPKSNVKVAMVSASGHCDSTKVKPVTADPKHAEFVSRLDPPTEIASINLMLSSVYPLSGMPCSSTHVDTLSQDSQLQHPLISAEALQQECSDSAGGKICGPVGVFTQLATSKDEIASTDLTFLGNTNTFDIRGHKQAGFKRSGGETADIFSELESLETLSQSATSNVSTMRKFQPKMIINVQPRNKLSVSRPIISEADCSIPCRETPSHQDQGYTILEEGLASAVSVPNASAIPYVNNNPGFLVVPQGFLNSKEAASSNNHGDGVSRMDNRILEKKVEAFADFTSEATPNMGNENGDNDEAFNGEDAANLKSTRQTSKKLAPGHEKTGRGHKKASEGSETLDKEPPKKTLSHSTRRNKRRVDKVLLETPEHEINPRELILRDLILLAEAKERLLVADPNAGNIISPYESTTFTQDTLFEEEVPFVYEEDQAVHSVQPKLNYHTFINKTSKERWSKQDTDLFYEGIQQFGTDFALIQQLFPGRTRHQVKLKYKKEERQQPMRLSDALTNRSKNHSHFELVIERLQKAAADAEAEHDSNREDESVGVTGEEEDITPNSNEEVSKKHDVKEANFEEEEVGEGVMEAEEVATMNHQGYSPAKSHQETEEDVYDIWSKYKSDI